MFLTLNFKLHNPSNRRLGILERISRLFSLALADVLHKAKRRWDKLPIWITVKRDGQPVYQTDKDGQTVLDANGQPVPLQRLNLPNYLTVWLRDHIDSPFRSQLASTLWYAVCKKAAGALLSHAELARMAAAGDKSLTSENVSFPAVDVDEARWQKKLMAELDQLASSAEMEPDKIKQAGSRLSRGTRSARYLPISFASSTDFAILANERGQLYLCPRLLARDDPKADRSVAQPGKKGELTDIEDPDTCLTNSKTSLLFPLECGRREEALMKRAGVRLKNPNRFQRGGPACQAKLTGLRYLDFTPKTGELFHRHGEWFFTVTGEVGLAKIEAKPQAFVGVYPTKERINCAVLASDGRVVEELELSLARYQEVVRESGQLFQRLKRRGRLGEMPNYGRELELITHDLVAQIIELAQRHQAAISLAKVVSVDKRTWVGKLNRDRSHFDFGRLETQLTYRPRKAGLPQVMVRRGRSEELYTVYDGIARFTCASCRETNVGKNGNPGGKKIAVENHWFHCLACGAQMPAGRNAARVVAKRFRDWVQNPKLRKAAAAGQASGEGAERGGADAS